MLKNLYAEQKTLEKVGDILGVSDQSVHDEMKRLGIPRLPKGHRGKSKCLCAICDLENTADLTYPEIAKAINFSESRVYFLLHKHGISYRKKRKEVKTMSPQKDKKGPPRNSQGPRDGRGKGKGRNMNSPGVGKQKGGKKGIQK